VLDLLIILFWQFIREQRDLIPRDKEIMLQLEPCGGGAIIARRTVYSDRGRPVLLGWPSVDAGVAALRTALRGPSRARYDLGIDDVVMLAQKLEQFTEPLYIELRSNGAACTVPRAARSDTAARRDLADWGLLASAAQALIWAIERARQRSVRTP
jgi:hypothetical protein